MMRGFGEIMTFDKTAKYLKTGKSEYGKLG